MSASRLLWVVVAVWAALHLLADIAVGANTPGLTIATGFVGCAAIIYVSKFLGSRFLQREETYYADVEEQDEGVSPP
jgi:hypothetical protein